MGATAAAKNKKIRQEALREQLRSQGHVQHVVDNIVKIESLSIERKSTAPVFMKREN